MGHADLVGVSVVLVEGDEDLRTALRLTLIQLGATAIEARNGREALEQVVRVKPQVILCDLRLPDMDGRQFMSNLREHVGSGHVPVIALPDRSRRRAWTSGRTPASRGIWSSR
jgi:two-component system, chemotaxis family, sensor histidine kinase and response regulator PixL